MPKSLLVFNDVPNKGKTSIWQVRSVGGNWLGAIRWHSPWRRYVFHPSLATLFDASCLREITDKLTELMDRHKKLTATDDDRFIDKDSWGKR